MLRKRCQNYSGFDTDDMPFSVTFGHRCSFVFIVLVLKATSRASFVKLSHVPVSFGQVLENISCSLAASFSLHMQQSRYIQSSRPL